MVVGFAENVFFVFYCGKVVDFMFLVCSWEPFSHHNLSRHGRLGSKGNLQNISGLDCIQAALPADRVATV